MNKIGFIGLGVMGASMAGHLSRNNFEVSVFNRTNEKSVIWKSRNKGKVCNSPNELAISSECIVLCVGKDEDVKDIINGKSGIIDALNPGSVIIDHTTTSAELAKEMNELLSSKECFFVDAPISGGQLGAESGTLSVMAGGDRKVYEACNKIFKSYSKSHKYMGPSGSGQLTKMVNQICIAGLIQALAEGMHFSRRAGLNTTDVMDVITKGAAQSWQMENRWETMLNDEYDFGFAVDLMRKDLDIVLKQAKKMDTELEVTNLVNNFYKEIQKSGGGRWDTSSLLKRIQQK
ncbi:NAD(P)-dependent oxidoreductase [Gammaproteobacteria bacterium]|jgi:2-hydroxy-3-oxopropionate reductase|nr:NAD(P)-dependent oxidoreductase [Gammaproteobacteria bacterium]MDC3217040.1 NAD(P)-dependent oxidoreductase [Gammaproteobacteria bacterium]MDC3268520.1 NAD(P)-dependent oxidoreductase [Gammaproteobacteria bacterium]